MTPLGLLVSNKTDADIDAFVQEMRDVGQEYIGICDGCAQWLNECLCDVDLAEVANCMSPYHPGCRGCEQAPTMPPARVRPPQKRR
jgi:hypothetical protein